MILPIFSMKEIEGEICAYPNCNKKSSKKSGRWKNHFCYKHMLFLKTSNFNISLKRVSETIKLENQRLAKEVERVIEEWAKNNFYWNEDTKQYEQDGLEINLKELKSRLFGEQK